MNHAELRKTAEAAFSHRHTSGCYKESSGPWCEWEPTNLQHWLTILALLDENAALRAVAEMCLPWTGTDHTAKYEALAEEFYQSTRMMAPGKDSAGFDGWSYEERRAKWDEWTAKRIARQRAQIIAALAGARV